VELHFQRLRNNHSVDLVRLLNSKEELFEFSGNLPELKSFSFLIHHQKTKTHQISWRVFIFCLLLRSVFTLFECFSRVKNNVSYSCVFPNFNCITIFFFFDTYIVKFEFPNRQLSKTAFVNVFVTGLVKHTVYVTYTGAASIVFDK